MSRYTRNARAGDAAEPDNGSPSQPPEIGRGLIDADLGGGVVKKRVALQGRGKRGGARTLIATNRASRWIFIFGFGKNERENITQAELTYLQVIAGDLLECPESVLKAAIGKGELQEACHESGH